MADPVGGEYLYREDHQAILDWSQAQWLRWVSKGAEGFELAKAAALAPPGPDGDHARAAWEAAVHLKHAAILAGAKAKRAALSFRPTGALDAPSDS